MNDIPEVAIERTLGQRQAAAMQVEPGDRGEFRAVGYVDRNVGRQSGQRVLECPDTTRR